MKPDIITTWPSHNDYPLWRQFIRDNRDRFDKVIIVFMNPNRGIDYRDFVKKAMADDNCLMINSPEVKSGEDWRNVAVNHGLKFSKSKWIWFTEQDFFPIRDEFWKDVEYKLKGFECVAYDSSGRLHPCCIFITRKLLDTLDKDFGIVPGQSDHFGKIQAQIEPKTCWGEVNKVFCKHYNGLTHNFTLISEGGMPNYRPGEFDEYLRKCIYVDVPHSEHFDEVVRKYYERAGLPRIN
jgi:hypothetical protein